MGRFAEVVVSEESLEDLDRLKPGGRALRVDGTAQVKGQRWQR